MPQFRSWRLSLASSLVLAFGLMLVLAIAGVLLTSLRAGITNTRELLADRTNLLLDTLSDHARGFLVPVERNLAYLAGSLGSGELEIESLAGERGALRDLLGATPQITSLALIRPDLQVWPFRRGLGALPLEDWSGLPRVRAAMERAPSLPDTVMWGEPLWSRREARSVLAAAIPVRRDGELMGLLVAFVAIEDLIRHVQEMSASIGEPVYVLLGEDKVVAAPTLDLAQAALGPDHALPTLAEAGDPVLAAMWQGERRRLGFLGDLLKGKAHGLAIGGTDYVYVYRELQGDAAEPWIVGTYVPSDVAEVEIRRLRQALGLAVACLLLGMLATFLIGRQMALPVRRLAVAASQIRTLDLDQVRPLPRSHVREIDEAATAFNAMRGALAWFEAYLPRRLVRQLMADPSPERLASRVREVTVLFTDIVGFSRLAQHLDATATADLLNRHFEMIAGCIAETDGTVDKYMGDGIMAFWGAPAEQPDHARRAVQAALAMRERLSAVEGSPGLHLRVGIHSGPALVGNIGAHDRLNYTLIGDTVNIAQRLEQLGKEVAPADDVVILVGPATAATASDLCPAQALGPRELRGRDETIEVFKLG